MKLNKRNKELYSKKTAEFLREKLKQVKFELEPDNRVEKFIYFKFIALCVIALIIIPIISTLIFAFTPNGSPLATHFFHTALSILFSKATLRIFIVCCLLDIIIPIFSAIVNSFRKPIDK